MAYAESTTVDESKSRAEIERLLQRHGAQRFGTMTDWEKRQAVVVFAYRNIQIQMSVNLPDPKAKEFTHTEVSGKLREKLASQKLYEQAIRQRWRSLVLLIKAKLIGITEGVSTFEVEFMPYMVTANGKTIADAMRPLIEEAKTQNGRIPARLGLPGPGVD